MYKPFFKVLIVKIEFNPLDITHVYDEANNDMIII